MKDTAIDEFIFCRSRPSNVTAENHEPARRLRLTNAQPNTTARKLCKEKDKLMTERKEQIEMLIAAKADVQKQLDVIFAEEGDKLIAAISLLSQVDPESAAQFLAQTTYAHFNAQDEKNRAGLIASFSSAFGAMAEQAPPNGAEGWDDEDVAPASHEEKQTSVDAA